MVKLGNPKNAFWEAFLLAAIVFVFGLLLGVSYEMSRSDKINEYYAISEISLMDAFASNNVIGLGDSNCDILIQANIDFANKIYWEARLLEKYEASGKLTNDLRLAHRKYDVLRTFLWINTAKTLERCEERFSTVVYLYEYEPEDLSKKAIQSVWSKILFDLKQEMGDEIILIPIAVDSDLISLDSLVSRFEIPQYPVLVINDEHVISELSTVEEIKPYLS